MRYFYQKLRKFSCKIMLAVSVLLCSCTSTDTNSIEKVIEFFPIEAHLTPSKIKILPVAMSPYKIFITRDKLVVFNMGKDTIFDVFQLPGYKYLYGSGTKGEGPGDFWEINTNIRPVSDGFQVLFEGNNTLKNVIVTDSKLYIDHTRETVLNIDAYPVNGFIQLSDSLSWYFTGFEAETEYNAYNVKNGDTKAISKYPDWNKNNSSNEDPLFTYIKLGTAKPDGTRVAGFYGYFKRFRILTENGELLKEVKVHTPPIETSLESDVMERITYYYTSPVATDKYIYAFCKNAKRGIDFNAELHLFTWDGEPVALYHLDEQPTVYTVDEERKKIYAFDDENEDCLLVYELP